MPKGFIRWYQESTSASKLDKQVDFFRRRGIHLTHPVLGTTLVLDVEGNDIPVERRELDRLLSIRIASINVNWWLSANVNLVDEYSFNPLGFDIQTIWLDGLDPQETRLSETTLQDIALDPQIPTRSLVVDRHGVSDPEQWDSIMLYDGETVPTVPDIVITQPEVAEKILRATPVPRREEMDNGMCLLAR
ncbi:hypothetical protein KME66_24435 [Streptomyces sp. YPW6]|uniref:hypothetical protein n=1 Tax=Streptomyces sp. YPW6 TaxID=2840373 RepID=UPI001C0E8EE0|nr:hypothetical protein [Streptomyces sp. YPW6]QWQ43769.1 hypothetical protein KME66_24435 [Streptomyces sp. YPW6]